MATHIIHIKDDPGLIPRICQVSDLWNNKLHVLHELTGFPNHAMSN